MTSTSLDSAANPLPPLAELARSLACTSDTGELLRYAVEGALLLTGAHGAYVEMVNSETAEVTVVATAGRVAPPLGQRAPYPGSLTQEIISEGAPRVLATIADVGDDIAPYLAEHLPACTALVAPLITLNEVMGTLVVLRAAESPVFSPREIAEARILADLTVLSFRRSELLRALSEEKRLRTAVLDQMPSGVMIAEAPSGRLVYYNREAERILGSPIHDVADTSSYQLFDALHPDGTSYRSDEYPIARALLGGESLFQERMLYRRADGSTIHLSVSAVPVRDERGETMAAVSTFHDVTRQREAEAELQRVFALERQSHERVNTILESISDAFFTLDREWRFTYLNRGARDAVRHLLGGDPQEVIGRSFWEVVPQFHGTRFEAEYRRAMETQEPAHFDEFSEALGVWFDVNAYPSQEGLSVYFRDITERKRAEEAIQQSEQRFRLLVESVRDYAIYMLDPTGHVVSWNSGAERIKGYSAEEIIGRHISVFYTEEDRQRGRPEENLRAAERNGRVEEEAWRVRKDGERIWADVVITPIRDEEGELLGYAKITRDLTERRRVEQRLRAMHERERAARAEAEEANRAKSDFLAAMSHELRTPINAIVGYTDLLDLGIGGPLTPEQRAHLERIKVSSQHLLGLIEDVLDLAKVEAGRVRVERRRMLAAEAVAAAISMMTPQALERGLALESTCTDVDETHFCGDGDRVRQIIVNLLSNAVKFTEPGGRVLVRCGTTVEPDPVAVLPGEGPWTFVQVRDTGIGIHPDKLEPIFQPFVQVETGHTRKRGGTGLGLAISRQLARIMGGDLTVRSEIGEGSTFTLWLPQVDVTAEPSFTDSTLLRWPQGLTRVAAALRTAVEPVTRAFLERMRADPDVPSSNVDDATLEDHTATLLLDIAQSLSALYSPTDAGRLLEDGTEIQQQISALHGAQRARLGWGEEAVKREFAILREEVRDALLARVERTVDIDLDGALDVVFHFLTQSEMRSLRALRIAGAMAPR